ncbi:hypothetical protein BSL78_16470 [Apostichopus japonicus]|uniref:C-type lectin domain-containing protein n=1 Tax=Stichopus japonicus TaxID=307972 RepID=A0A2G8KFD9_STIJA|nr:hypothetical protein BSL78_16470 [Apostichopus japonicus]
MARVVCHSALSVLLWALLTQSSWAGYNSLQQRSKRGEIDPDNTDLVGPVITYCPDDIHLTIPKCDSATEATATWPEPTAEDKVSTANLFEQNFHSGDSFPLSGEDGHLVYYDFIDEAENIESCLFSVFVERAESEEECLPDCIIGEGKRIPSRSTFLTSDCSQRCTCDAGTLVCEDHGCGELQACTKTKQGSRACYCKRGYVRDRKNQECYKRAFTVRTHSMKYTFIKELTPGNHRVEFYLQAEDESRLILNDVPNNKGTIYEFDRFSWMRKAESWTYENWSSKEPNSYDERRACAVMKGDCDGQWSDICCSFAKSFICEKK